MNLKQVRIPYAVLRKLPDVLRENHFKVKCVVRTAPNDLFVYDIFGKDEEVVVGGLAVDIGTTTVSAVLINMETGDSCQGFFWKRTDPFRSRCYQPYHRTAETRR